MLGIKVVIEGGDDIARKLDKLGESLVMFEGAFRDIGENLVDYFEGQVFASQGGILNDRWPELSDEYRAWKAVHYPGRPPLVRTGAMQSGFTFNADDTSLTIGNEVDYFKYHQSTAERTSNLPRRAMLAVNDDVRSIVAHLINADVKRKLYEVGL